jgi:predicted small metal-binding protein
MSVLNCRYYGFECNYEMEGDIKTIADEFINHIKKEHVMDYPREILTNVSLMKKP